MCVKFFWKYEALQVKVQVTWQNDRWWKVLHIKPFGIVHFAVPTVIMFGASHLLCSLLKSQLLYMYLEMLVCCLMSTLLGEQGLQLFLKNGQFICRKHPFSYKCFKDHEIYVWRSEIPATLDGCLCAHTLESVLFPAWIWKSCIFGIISNLCLF